jgi:hypothetical protein
MKTIEKLRVMLPHWIEHNASHLNEFAGWAEQVEKTDQDIAALLHQAAASLRDADQALRTALARSGGEMKEQGAHHHHHHHHNLPE